MRRTRERVAGAMVVLGAFVIGGCGDSLPPVSTSQEEATVNGIVTIKGKPATDSTIILDPANVRRPEAGPRSATIGTDGRFTLKTLVGGNRVTVTGPDLSKDSSLKNPTPELDVVAGDNTLNIDIKADPNLMPKTTQQPGGSMGGGGMGGGGMGGGRMGPGPMGPGAMR